jgi:cytochrome oxidase Cu insertion factor (SCO1/SenC/PrrC family)
MEKSSLLPSRPKLIFASVMIILAVIAAALALTLRADGPQSSGTALIGGPFTMVNQKSETVTEKTYAGQYTLVFFGFTFCPDVCPTELQVITAAFNQMGADAEKITPIFVTIDPERDTPDVMANYVTSFHPRLQGLTGTPEQVAVMAKAYHIYYQKVPDPKNPKDYEMDHSAIIYLMGPDGKFLKHFTYSTDAKALSDALQKVLHS